MKLKKVLLMSLSLVLVAAIAIGATLAYLTSTDSDVNVMTLGNVSIAQHEYERVVNADGSFATTTVDGQTSYVLKDFEQGKDLLPIVGDPNEPGDSPAYAGWDETIVRMTQVDSYGNMQVFAGKNAQDKFVTVENTGKYAAYVRTLVAIENGTGDANLIGISSRAVSADKADASTAPWVSDYLGKITIDGNTYGLYEYVYRGASDVNRHVNGVLPAGDTTYPSLCQVYLKSKTTNEDCEALDGNDNGTLDILVLSQAVQSEGFTDAKTALDTAFGTSAEKAAEWFSGTKVPVIVDKDSIKDALDEGKDVVFGDDIEMPAEESNSYGKTAIKVYKGQTLDGADNSFKAQYATDTWDSAITAYGGTIKNLTVGKGFRGIFISHITGDQGEKCGLVTFENVVIDGPTYTFNCDQGTNNGLKAIDSTFNGWTSYAATLGNVEFINCDFGEGAGYSFCRPFAPTEFVGCDFEAGYKMEPCAAVSFKDCTIGGVPLTTDNLATLVISNIENASVK